MLTAHFGAPKECLLERKHDTTIRLRKTSMDQSHFRYYNTFLTVTYLITLPHGCLKGTIIPFITMQIK